MTSEEVNEFADSPSGAVPRALAITSPAEAGASSGMPASNPSPATLSYANVSKDGSVEFEKTKSTPSQ
jgi:hypothetical protein